MNTLPTSTPSRRARLVLSGPALLAGCITVALALRLLYCFNVELLPEETYYWNYGFAGHLDIGYFDHPPMVAWLIRLCTDILGNTEFGVRCGALICCAITSIYVHALTRNLFDAAAARFALLLVQLLPFFFLSGILMTPDAALGACWAASLYYFERALLGGRRLAWAGVGISLGLGLLSKYTIALLGVSVLSFMVFDPQARRWLTRWEPYAAAVLALALFAPVILWNMRHEWASFAFQTVHRLADRPQFALHKLIASTLVLLTPTGVWAAWDALRGAPATTGQESNGRWLFLRCTTLVPLLVFALFSLRHEVKLDWTGVVWLAALPAMAACMASSQRAAGAALARAWSVTLLLLIAGYGYGVYALATGVPGASLAKQPELIPIGWKDLAEQVSVIAQTYETQTGKAPIVVGMDRYATASELIFYAPHPLDAQARTTATHLFGGVGLMYELWSPRSQALGRDLLLVGWKKRDLDDRDLSRFARDIGPVQTGTVSRRGKTVRSFYYRFLHDYRDVEPGVR